MKLPQFTSDDDDFQRMQNAWASKIEPVLNNAIVNGLLLEGQALASGVTVVNHRLGRKLRGWFLTDSNGAATVYRSAPKNNLTLTLTSSAAITADIYVF